MTTQQSERYIKNREVDDLAAQEDDRRTATRATAAAAACIFPAMGLQRPGVDLPIISVRWTRKINLTYRRSRRRQRRSSRRSGYIKFIPLYRLATGSVR